MGLPPGQLDHEQSASILIVDDEPMIQNALRRACARAGFEPPAVLDGRRTFELALSRQPDLILLDIHMPTADGRHLASAQGQ